jgi:hypothetical protein
MNNKQFKEQLDLASKRELTFDSRIERKAVNGLSGMYAKEPIPKDTVLASYPTKHQIQLRKDISYPEAASDNFKYIHAASIELAKGPASQHHDILLSLEPISELQKKCTYFYSENDLELITKMNPVLARNINESKKQIQDRVDALAKFDPKLDSRIVLRVLLNMVSRAFAGYGFASAVDAFNHSDRLGNPVKALDNEGKVIGFIANKNYERGEQIFITYDRKDMYAHAIAYNYFDEHGTHFIDYGARIIQTAITPLEKKIFEYTSKYYKLKTTQFNGITQYTAKDLELFFLEHAPSTNLIDFIRKNCFQSPGELISGKCSNKSFDERLLAIINELIELNHIDDFELNDIPKKLHRFYHLLKKEKAMLLSNRNWVMDNRSPQQL